MSDMLLMPAFKVGNPVAAFIHMKINDLLHRPRNVWLHWFHGVPFWCGRKAGLEKHFAPEE